MTATTSEGKRGRVSSKQKRPRFSKRLLRKAHAAYEKQHGGRKVSKLALRDMLLAAGVKVHPNTLGNWFSATNKAKPDIDAFRELLDIYDLDWFDLFE